MERGVSEVFLGPVRTGGLSQGRKIRDTANAYYAAQHCTTGPVESVTSVPFFG